MKRIGQAVSLTILAAALAHAQERTVGLMLNTAGAYPGYTLFAPVSYPTTYLIDNEGRLVHSWPSKYLPGWGVYLNGDGYLYRTITIPDTTPPFGTFGGGLEKIDWDGNVVWHYEYASATHRMHHDIAVLPNGHVLMIAWETKDTAAMIAAGRNPALMPVGCLLPEEIIEVAPVNDTAGEIVWEWHVWDHLVQNFDATKPNYGIIIRHPDLIDLNFIGDQGVISDWIHLNSVYYNQPLDQIMLTSRLFDEIWVIDHSTTTAQARSHIGGRYGTGGDLLYRWGNPRTYGYGTENDQKLFAPHDGHWIESGLPGAGHILIFNNGYYGTGGNYSSVDEIVPPIDGHGFYSTLLPFGPPGGAWGYTSQEFFSSVMGGAQREPNGNTLICNSQGGTFFEVTPDGSMVWRYINPVDQDGPVYQGDSILGQMNQVFKIQRYPPDYAGLQGRDLTPLGPIEKSRAVGEAPSILTTGLTVSPALFHRSLDIAYQLGAAGNVRIQIYNILGREVKTLVDKIQSAGSFQIIWDGIDNSGQRLSAGVYFCKLESRTTSLQKRIVLIK